MINFFLKVYLKIKRIIRLIKYLLSNEWKYSKNYQITGCRREQGKFRVPWNKKLFWRQKEFFWSNLCIPGTKIHFISDSLTLKVTIFLGDYNLMNHMSPQSISGVDVYEKGLNERKWIGCFSAVYPNNKIEIILFPNGEKKEYEIILPSYVPVYKIKMKKEGGKIYRSNKVYDKKIVIYGSSITQGCAASRPGMTYTNLLGEMLNAEIFNYGFSGSAKGELEVIETMKSINMDAFIMEYDHNATIEELQETHYRVYSVIRSEVDVPIIMFSRLSKGISITEEEQEKRETIIKESYNKALEKGDKNVFYICGSNIISDTVREQYFTDDRHPNDMGMYMLANKLAEKLKEVWSFD